MSTSGMEHNLFQFGFLSPADWGLLYILCFALKKKYTGQWYLWWRLFLFFSSGWCWEKQSDSLPLSSSAVKSQIRHNNSVLLKDSTERCRQLGVPIMKFALCLQDCFIDINGLLYPNDRAAGSSALVCMGPLVLFLGPWKRPAVSDHDSVSGRRQLAMLSVPGRESSGSSHVLLLSLSSESTCLENCTYSCVPEACNGWASAEMDPWAVASCGGWRGIQCSHTVCAKLLSHSWDPMDCS